MTTLILGLETSCDETSVALVRDGRTILTNIIRSQMKLHERFGGVVPELASRQHLIAITPALDAAFEEAGVGRDDVDAIAVTEGPGLAGSLLVGVNVAKALALAWDLPLVPVNHLEGHIYANWLSRQDEEPAEPPAFPALCLIVSGGHTELILMRGHGDYELLGRTLDDAAGEAFDKGARVLGLGYPGGPAIQNAADKGLIGRHPLPRAWLGDSFDFSFSGLKTALLREVDQYRRVSTRKRQPATDSPFLVHEPPEYSPNMPVADLAADFQEAIVEVLIDKTARAARETGARTVLLAGGVAANRMLRTRLGRVVDVPPRYPPLSLCTDNAAMIAGAAFYVRRRGIQAGWDLDIQPHLPLVSRTGLRQ